MKNHTLLAVVGVLAVTSAAHAERRQNTLAGDVAVRHRRLLVNHRLELTPLFESTINADFRHIVGGGAKLEYHLSDKWSVGVVGVASTALNTKLVDKIVPTLEPMTDNKTREPSQAEFTDRLNTMPLHGAAYISLTPWYGKLAAFGQAYVAFDLSNWQFSFGRQSLWWGTGPIEGGSLDLSNNSQPINMFRVSRTTPLKLPSVLGLSYHKGVVVVGKQEPDLAKVHGRRSSRVRKYILLHTSQRTANLSLIYSWIQATACGKSLKKVAVFGHLLALCKIGGQPRVNDAFLQSNSGICSSDSVDLLRSQHSRSKCRRH